MATINGTFNSLIAGTLSGTVATPGAPGVGVPAGGSAGQVLAKVDGVSYNTEWVNVTASAAWGTITGTLSAQSDLQSALDAKQSVSGMSAYLSKAGNLAGLTDLSVSRDNLNLGTANTPVFAGLTAQGSGANVANLTPTSLTLTHATSGSFVIQPSQGIVFPDSTIQTTAFTASSLSGYAPLLSPAFTGNPTAPTPSFGDNDTSIATTAFVQAGLLGGTANARNLEVEVRNQSGSTIPAGSIVYISGATGNRPLITLAQANNDANSAQTMGFVKTSIANNGTGYVIVRGELENIDTSALTEGVQLYLSPTVAGTWTTTKPSAPQHLVYVGIVVRAHPTQGVILVAVQNGYELNELHDVSINGKANNDLLAYESSTNLWKNKTFSALGLLTSADAASTYQTLSGMSSYLTTSAAASTYLTQSNAASTYQTQAGMTNYLSKAGNLSGLASTSTARTNLGLGTLSTVNDAPADGSQYARKNNTWEVVSGGGGSFTGGPITTPITYTVGSQVSTMQNGGFNVTNLGTFDTTDIQTGIIYITSTGSTMTIYGGGIQFPDTTVQTTAGIGDAPYDFTPYNRMNNSWVSAIPEAPIDGNYYVRKDGGWVSCTVVGIYDGNSGNTYNCLTV